MNLFVGLKIKMWEYDSTPITTMTLVAETGLDIDQRTFYLLVPITYLSAFSNPNKPLCDVKGGVLSAVLGKQRRGLPGKPFKNNVVVSLSMGVKNLGLKVGGNTIQMIGAKSLEMAHEGVYIIIQYVDYIQRHLDRMHEDPERLKRTVDWILEATRVTQDGEDLVFPPEGYHARQPFTFPPGVDEMLARWMLPMISEFSHHSKYKRFLEHIQTIKHVNLTGSEISKEYKLFVCMINRNFTLPFQIHRKRLYDIFYNLEGWNPIYDSTYSSSVRLRVKAASKRRKNGEGYVTFSVFSTGAVALSGSDNNECREVFNAFKEIILLHRDEIALKTRHQLPERKVQFYPAIPFKEPYCLEGLLRGLSEQKTVKDVHNVDEADFELDSEDDSDFEAE